MARADLDRLTNERGNLAVVALPVAADQELHEAFRVPEDGGSVGLSDPDQAFAVHFDDLIVDLRQEKHKKINL